MAVESIVEPPVEQFVVAVVVVVHVEQQVATELVVKQQVVEVMVVEGRSYEEAANCTAAADSNAVAKERIEQAAAVVETVAVGADTHAVVDRTRSAGGQSWTRSS